MQYSQIFILERSFGYSWKIDEKGLKGKKKGYIEGQELDDSDLTTGMVETEVGQAREKR